jgi:small neutral amino acid transporter SnatA (MarC family)
MAILMAILTLPLGTAFLNALRTQQSALQTYGERLLRVTALEARRQHAER